jgi:hypothetical protein
MGLKTLRVWASIYKSTTALPTVGWISLRSADSAAVPDSSTSTSRHASSRGLVYFYSTSWIAIKLKSNSRHILQDDPSIREEVLDSRLGGSVPRVLRFFLSGFNEIFLPKLQMDPQQSLQLNLRLGGYFIWSAILQSHFHVSFGFKTTRALLKTFKGTTRGRLGLLEKTSGLLKHQLEYIPASGCFNYS